MIAPTPSTIIAIVVAVTVAACSGGGGDDASPTTASTVTVTTQSPTTAAPTTATTSTTSPDRPVTPPDVLAADGIASAEDAAVFVVTSWIAGDREEAARHAEVAALDTLFDAPPPAADAIELIECDTADLERYDCFFTADGRIIVIGVDRVRVVEASLDSD